MRAARHELGGSLQNRSGEQKRLRMTWIVTIDENGTRRFCMNWSVDWRTDPQPKNAVFHFGKESRTSGAKTQPCEVVGRL
jgi:hypothetical protein